MLTDKFINPLVTVCKQHRWILIAGLVGLLLLEVALLLVEKPRIEQDILARVSDILNQKGFNRVDVEVSGREVVLNGVVSSMSAENFALEFSYKTYGRRTVTSNLEIIPLRLPHLIISRNLNNDLKLEGEVPTQLLVNQFVELVKSTISHEGFISLLHADPEVTDPEWTDTVEAILVEGNYLSGMDVEIGAGQLSLGGMIADESGYSVLVRRIQQFTNDRNLSFVNKIGIKPTTENLQEQELDNNDNTTELGDLKSLDDASRSDELPTVEWEKIKPAPVIPGDDGSVSLQQTNVPGTTGELTVGPKTETGVEFSVDDKTKAEEKQIFREDVQIATADHGLELENCQTRLNNSLVTRPITFSSNSTVIPVDNYTIIEKLYKIIEVCPTFKVFVGGHTDSRGSPTENRLLSNRRAEAVMEVLIGLGVDTSRISSEGFGAAKPIASNETSTGRQQNRRIEIILTD